jgi:rSAM/selenodomain-associated transferase 1
VEVRAEAAGCGVAVMAKASAPGRTKTRLVPPLTFEEAAAFNTAFLQDVADNLAGAGRHASIAPYMAFGPPGSDPFFREHLPPSVGLIETWFPNFGDCLLHAVSSLLVRGHASACVLNSDSPTLPTALLVEMADILSRPGDRAVLGPSTDGGYYLLAVKRPHRRLFEEVAWSTERVAEQTLDRAREIGLPVHVLPAWYDVDDAASLRALHGELIRGVPFAGAHTSHHARHSRRLLRRLLAESDLARRFEVADAPVSCAT